MSLQFQKVEFEPGQSFYLGRFANPDFNFPYHFHPEIELYSIHGGHCTAMVGDTVFQAKAGSTFIVGRNVPHCYRNEPGDSSGPHWARCTILLFRPRQTLGDHLLQLPESAGLSQLIDRINQGGIHVTGKTGRQLMTMLKEKCALEGIGRLIGLLQILQMLAEAPIADLPAIAPPEHPQLLLQKDLDRLSKVLKYIEQHYADALRLETMAQVAHMAPTAFSRYFKGKTGHTFQRHLLEFRISQACAQLLQTDAKITEIAFASGFQNLSNFNQQFKSVKGMSPSAFREHWRLGQRARSDLQSISVPDTKAR